MRRSDRQAAEHELNVKISENDVRKGFTKSERVDYMKRLLRIEQAKAKERQNLGEKIPEGGGNREISQPNSLVSYDAYGNIIAPMHHAISTGLCCLAAIILFRLGILDDIISASGGIKCQPK